ncbi:hypothetical protein PROFUN_05851 [Planoprotostelium fungivorum]|uniref:Uncharacterized protein n=1 Tax=Planoprotostelium fungivorum TaxID=1890364 RepID=A0A2P6NKR5_9EUKA|nr:hypothetical protein PROFUN_05851 [Planoprotostelium fungivorum]
MGGKLLANPLCNKYLTRAIMPATDSSKQMGSYIRVQNWWIF